MEISTKVDIRDTPLSSELEGVEDAAIDAYAKDGIKQLAFQSSLESRFSLDDSKYTEAQKERYVTLTDKLIEARCAHGDTVFQQISDVQREMFGKGVAAALYGAAGVENKTAALRDVIALYRDTYQDNIEAVEAGSSEEDAGDASDKGTNLRQTIALSARGAIDNFFAYENDEYRRFARTRNLIGRAAFTATALSIGLGSYAEYRAHRYQERTATEEGVDREKRKVMFAAGTFGVLGLTILGATVAHRLGYTPGSGSSTSAEALNNLPHVERPKFNTAAQVNIITDGYTNPTSGNLTRMIQNTPGMKAHEAIPIHYPAEIAPLPGSTHTLEQSSSIAENNIYQAYLANKGKSMNIIGYSEGSVGTMQALNRIAAENGGQLPDNITATIIGGPAVPGGVGDNEITKAIDPMLKVFGIDITGDGPQSGKGITYYTNESDFWGSAGTTAPVSMIDKGIGTAFGGTHNYDAAALTDPSRHTVTYNPDGSKTILIKGGPAVVDGYRVRSGIGNALAQNQGVKVTREMDEAILSLRGDANGNYDVADITDKLAKLADQQQPGAGVAVRTILPNIATQELANQVTRLQTELPRAIGAVTNPGALPAPSVSGTTELSTPTAESMTPLGTTVSPAPAITQLPQLAQQPVRELLQSPGVNDAAQGAFDHAQKVAPQLGEALQQGKVLANQLGLKVK